MHVQTIQIEKTSWRIISLVNKVWVVSALGVHICLWKTLHIQLGDFDSRTKRRTLRKTWSSSAKTSCSIIEEAWLFLHVLRLNRSSSFKFGTLSWVLLGVLLRYGSTIFDTWSAGWWNLNFIRSFESAVPWLKSTLAGKTFCDPTFSFFILACSLTSKLLLPFLDLYLLTHTWCLLAANWRLALRKIVHYVLLSKF